MLHLINKTEKADWHARIVNIFVVGLRIHQRLLKLLCATAMPHMCVDQANRLAFYCVGFFYFWASLILIFEIRQYCLKLELYIV